MSGKRKFTNAQFRAAYDSSSSVLEMRMKLGCSLGCVYNYLRRMALSFRHPTSEQDKDCTALELFRQYKWAASIRELAHKFHYSRMIIRTYLGRAIELIWGDSFTHAHEEFRQYRGLPVPRHLWYIRIYYSLVKTMRGSPEMSVRNLAHECRMSEMKVKAVLLYVKAPKEAEANPKWRREQDRQDMEERVIESRDKGKTGRRAKT